jgi:hypothetical protein
MLLDFILKHGVCISRQELSSGIPHENNWLPYSIVVFPRFLHEIGPWSFSFLFCQLEEHFARLSLVRIYILIS